MTLWNLYEKSEVFRKVEGGEMSIAKASLFVSGILLRETVFPDMDFCGYPEYVSMDEMWYMICLHHDKRMEQQRIWEQLCRERNGAREGEWEILNIAVNRKWQPLHLCFSPLFQYLEGGVCFTNGTCVKKCRFSEAELIDYFYFRNTCYRKGGTDHGIVGGLFLYENLICRHLQQKGEPDRKTLDLYSYVANTMMVHNICEKYRGMEPIASGKDPLLFLIALAEVIEPLQYRTLDVSYRVLLDAVTVDVFERKLILRPEPYLFHLNVMEEKCKKFSDYVSIVK